MAQMQGGARYTDVIDWIAVCIIPHEAGVRGWLRRLPVGLEEDDLIQEAYCRLAQLHDYEAVADPRSYFFATVRNLLREQVRRQQVVQILHLADLDGFEAVDDKPSPEDVTGGRREFQRLHAIINDLPAACRQIFILRKVENLSQRSVAKRLDVTENVVEKRTAQGLRLVLKAWTNPARHRPNDHMEPDVRRWK